MPEFDINQVRYRRAGQFTVVAALWLGGIAVLSLLIG
jgi:hypothetical protein